MGVYRPDTIAFLVDPAGPATLASFRHVRSGRVLEP